MQVRLGRILLFIWLTSLPSFGQDLNKLPDRVSKLWALRLQNKKQEALRFIDPESQHAFLAGIERPITKVAVSAIRFTEDPKRVEVVLKARFSFLEMGDFDQLIRENWVWSKGDWFLHTDLVMVALFEVDDNAKPAAARPPEFSLVHNVEDAGRHTQGDIVNGKIEFQAKRTDIQQVQIPGPIRGLTLGPPNWTSDTAGYIQYTLDTTLLSENIRQTVTLVVTGVNDLRIIVDLQFSAQIDGKLAFKQTPEIVDPAQPGQVEVEVKNLTKDPVQIFSIAITNPAYTVDEGQPEIIPVGEAVRIKFQHQPQRPPMGAALNLMLSERLSPSPILIVPIRTKPPEQTASPGLTVEEMRRLAEEAIRKQGQQPGVPPR